MKKWCDNKTYFTMHSKDKFLSYYYNFIKEVEINNNNYNTIMHNIQETDLSKFENNKLNILFALKIVIIYIINIIINLKILEIRRYNYIFL